MIGIVKRDVLEILKFDRYRWRMIPTDIRCIKTGFIGFAQGNVVTDAVILDFHSLRRMPVVLLSDNLRSGVELFSYSINFMLKIPVERRFSLE